MATWFEVWQRERETGTGREVSTHPFYAYIGHRYTCEEPGRAVVELLPERHHLIGNRVQGGILCIIADAAMAIAHQSLLDETQRSVTIELKINFLRAARAASRLTATGRVIRAGRTITLLEAQVTDGDGQLIAHTTSTCMAIDLSAQ